MPMSNANDKPLGYAAAADAYWQAGWRGVLPFHARSKWPPPAVKEGGKTIVSYTGYSGVDPSYPDIMAWCEQYVDGNLGLRLPNDDVIAVVGIDVDDYDSKTGAATFAEAVRRWGPLPAAPRSTSREGNKISGIRLFRVPSGTQLETVIAFPELGIGDIEIIQHHHRYIIAWPSIHPEGRPYWWRNDDDQFLGIPEPDGLPWLPRSWVDGLKVQPRVPGEAKADVMVTLTDGEPSMAVKLRLGTAISELNLPGTSRHDTCTRHVMALTRLGKSGEPGVKQALHVLCNVLIAARQVDKSDTPEGTRLEFERMLTNDNLARELATPGITDWVQDLVIDEEVGQGGGNDQGEGAEPSSGAPAGEAPPGDQPETVSSPGAPELDGAANAPSDNEGRDLDTTRPRSRLEDIEQGFWDSRESLKMVYNTAMARMCPPWAVLAHTAGRALTMVRPHVTLPPLIGGRGSLNWFAAVVAPSGGGKGASSACAQLLVPAHIETRNVGSGEGIIAAFGRPADDDDPTPIHEALMFTADEVDTLAAMNQRSASTTLSILRSGFSGETIGFSYAAREKRRHIGAHTYRMTFVVSVQPTRAGWLIDDGGGGTPQRFMWFPGTDSRVAVPARDHRARRGRRPDPRRTGQGDARRPIRARRPRSLLPREVRLFARRDGRSRRDDIRGLGAVGHRCRRLRLHPRADDRDRARNIPDGSDRPRRTPRGGERRRRGRQGDRVDSAQAAHPPLGAVDYRSRWRRGRAAPRSQPQDLWPRPEIPTGSARLREG
jgi:hypothetical protein